MKGQAPLSAEVCLSGEALYGDDFPIEEITAWYADEAEGYANLGAKDSGSYRYVYHAWNRYHAFRHLPDKRYARVLAFGSAYGDELLPLIHRIGEVTVVDPSAAFRRNAIHGVPATYVKPAVSGELPIADDVFDLGTCLGVLHHIPNVSAVVREIVRTMAPGGYLVLREPIVSMGDWRGPRPGLTVRERGIPRRILKEICLAAGLEIINESVCGFSLTDKVLGAMVRDVYNSPLATRVDALVSRAMAWNVNYHPRSLWDRLRPTSEFLLLRKPARLRSAC